MSSGDHRVACATWERAQEHREAGYYHCAATDFLRAQKLLRTQLDD